MLSELFLYPWMLVLLVIPITAVAWGVRRRGRRIALPYDYHQSTTRTSWPALITIAECLPALLMSIVIVILANPLHRGQPVSKRKLTNIQLLIDCSSSMGNYDEAVGSFHRFVDSRPDDAFGLTYFGGRNLTWVPITTDVSAIKCSAPFMHPQVRPHIFSGTRLGGALLDSRAQFAKRKDGKRVAIAISDGASSDLYNGGYIDIANELNKFGITVYLISVTGSYGVDEAAAQICQVTGGKALEADDDAGISRCFEMIDDLEKAELEKKLPEVKDDFYLVAIIGLATSSLALLSSLGMRYTPW